MNNELDKIQIIEVNKLDSQYYFQSLLEQAHEKELLCNRDIERMQYECIELVSVKSKQYNLNYSSSITIEKAQDIMTSNLFTISIWLKTFSNPDDAIKVLKSETIKDIYEKGRKKINIMLASTKTIHDKLVKQLIKTQNVFYKSTIDEGINGFFKLYYPDFSAHEIHITADYQTFNVIPKLDGIEFIQTYLNYLYYENMFCNFFLDDNIHHLLCGYVKDYEEHLINIYELILITALGCTIVGTDIYSLDITDKGEKYLHNLFLNTSIYDIPKIVKNATDTLVYNLDCSQNLINYINNSLPLIISRIQAASKEQMLDKLFIKPFFPENEAKIFVSYGDKMNDEKYKEIVEEIISCRYIEDKIIIIKENIHSLADLEDILLDAELTEQEIQSILSELKLQEIAVLSNRYLSSYDMDTFNMRDQEKLFRKTLYFFVKNLPQKNQDMIEKIRDKIQE